MYLSTTKEHSSKQNHSTMHTDINGYMIKKSYTMTISRFKATAFNKCAAISATYTKIYMVPLMLSSKYVLEG